MLPITAKSPKNIIVTGGLGFIGKHFVRRCLEQGDFVVNIDSAAYSADRVAAGELTQFNNYRFYEKDIATLDFLGESDLVVNFAAESHVDSAITNSRNFCRTNFLGVQNLLELVRQKQESEQPLFVQIGTDEVYGDIAKGQHEESDMLVPSNPYAATKAAADMLVMSWGRTYGTPWNIVRPTNNYGEHQYPEKLIPKSVWRMKRGKRAILHGDGTYRRCWLHAEDTVDAILTVIEKGVRNRIYNAGGDEEFQNVDVVRAIAAILGIGESEAWVFMPDRSGQDIRYSLDDKDLRALGWRPRRKLDEELEKIVASTDVTRFG